jgi:hypothetical protein
MKDDPANLKLKPGSTIEKPTAIIEVNEGKEYTRIVAVKHLENTIIEGINNLEDRLAGLTQSFDELDSRDTAQERAYARYTVLPSTKQDCGYKYNFSYSYSLYNYSSPYTYRCETVSNFDKDLAYISYTSALRSYNNQVDYHNKLIDDYNNQLDRTQNDIESYRSYDYN